ncbi:MAG: response regulator transcription factor [Alphaproteobacteria bacterium]
MDSGAEIHVVEDDEAVLDSLALLLRRQGYTVHPHDSAGGFLAAFNPERFGCIISDVRMPGMSGIELVAELGRRRALHPILLISGHGDIEMAVGMIKAGVFDFIEKPFTDSRLLTSLRAALEQGIIHWEENLQLAALTARTRELSSRQQEVMDLVVQGLANKEIAARLGISPRTVEIYQAWVMEKMGARTLAELVRMAMRVELARK